MEYKERYYSVKQVAEILHMTEGTVRNKMWKKEIPFVKLGAGRVLIRKKDIDKMLEGKE